AMACGLPVIAARGVGAGADLIREGETGCVFPNGDAETLGERLRFLHDDREARARMGRAATARVANWSYAQTLDEMEGALDYVRTRSE
ncbi:MAG: glycosyltransferase, partial [Chromatiaceae bacterium]